MISQVISMTELHALLKDPTSRVCIAPVRNIGPAIVITNGKTLYAEKLVRAGDGKLQPGKPERRPNA